MWYARVARRRCRAALSLREFKKLSGSHLDADIGPAGGGLSREALGSHSCLMSTSFASCPRGVTLASPPGLHCARLFQGERDFQQQAQKSPYMCVMCLNTPDQCPVAPITAQPCCPPSTCLHPPITTSSPSHLGRFTFTASTSQLSVGTVCHFSQVYGKWESSLYNTISPSNFVKRGWTIF